jgi:hypothetical protein
MNSFIYHGGSAGGKKGYSSSVVPVDLNDKVKITSADTTENYLNSKLVVGTGLTKSTLNPGANEQIQIVNSIALDHKAKTTVADTTPNFLDSKIVVGIGLTKTVLNPGANETVQLSNSVVLDYKAKVTSADTTPNFLNSKISAGTGISLAVTSPGGNEGLQISSSLTDKKRYTLCFGTGGALGVESFIPATTGGTTWASNGVGHYIKNASKIIAWGIQIPKYVSYNSAHYCRFQLKTIVSDGSRASDITSASGTNLKNYDFTFPNTSGAYRFYIGKGETGVSYTLNAGEMLFVVICAMDVNAVLGAAIWVLCEET